MTKKKTAAAETLRMHIELADNGIILRNPDCEDEVTLAAHNGNPKTGYDLDFINESRAIGNKIYRWLTDVVLQEQNPDEIIVTGFHLEISAKCEGRAMYD